VSGQPEAEPGPDRAVVAEAVGRRKGRAAPAPPRPLLSRDAFARLVLVERRRSERSGRSFGILVIDAHGSSRRRAAAALARRTVRDAVTAATRETDVIGWIAAPSVLGVLLPDLPEAGPWAAVERVRGRIERAGGPHGAAEAAGPAVPTVKVLGRLFPEPVPGEVAARDRLVRTAADDLAALLEPLLYPELRETRGRRRLGDAVKRGLDTVASGALLLALAPLGLLLAGLVRLSSPGPVLFRQTRVGYRGRPFTMLKFRTMYTGADQAAHREFVTRFIADGARATPPDGATMFKLTNDPRVTPLGRLLRKTSLDELPQLWNILRGEMSLVGPRPPLPYEVERYAPWHRRRVLEARPGLTGLWQVRGRSRTTFDEMVRLDLRYARTRSLARDLGILLATPRAVISGKGAE
jgi:lipopolysaccharide/colanic/teichoic acid biosynthesis glycosyltransferase